MINIPTDLLRTLVAVVDLRSFTRAAQMLGVTQPAVSAQIKRLQVLLGVDLLDKSTPGVMLTPAGETVVGHARRILSINDQILDLSHAGGQAVRIGISGDFAAAALSRSLACYRVSHPEMRFSLRCGQIDRLLENLRDGEIDIALGFSASAPQAPLHWSDRMVWLRGHDYRRDPQEPVPLVAYDDDCVFRRAAVEELAKAGLRSELVYSGTSIVGLTAAVTAGLGVMVLPRSRIEASGLVICDDLGLPALPDAYCGLYVRDGAGCETREEVAGTIAAALRPGLASADAIPSLSPA